MKFAPDPSPPPSRRPEAPRSSRWFLHCACIVAVVAAIQPWLRVAFPGLFLDHFGPPGWQSTPGFTCLMTALMVLLITLIESGTTHSKAAVQPARALLTAVAGVVMAATAWAGPGVMRGTTAAWTHWFWAAAAAVAAMLAASVWLQHRHPASGR